MKNQLLELTQKQIKKFIKIYIVGDIHGDLKSLQSVLNFIPKQDCLTIFLGDYADRGKNSLKVVETINELITENPNEFIALKGNHEDYNEEGEPKFFPCTLIDEVQNRYGDWDNFFLKRYKKVTEK